MPTLNAMFVETTYLDEMVQQNGHNNNNIKLRGTQGTPMKQI
jgi:hypothetical protein